jgi:hypothetical protein
MTNYKMKKIGTMLKKGNARIAGRVSLSQQWPDEPHAWIVEDLVNQRTMHVLVSDRPSWSRYCQA